MEILRVFLLSKIFYKFGLDEFKYTEVKIFMQKAYRIPNLFINDIMAGLIQSKDFIKTDKGYRLRNDIDEYITCFLEKSHLERNKILAPKLK